MKEIIMTCACDCKEYTVAFGAGNTDAKCPHRTCPDCGKAWKEKSRHEVECE